jgi:hypothetical protein
VKIGDPKEESRLGVGARDRGWEQVSGQELRYRASGWDRGVENMYPDRSWEQALGRRAENNRGWETGAGDRGRNGSQNKVVDGQRESETQKLRTRLGRGWEQVLGRKLRILGAGRRGQMSDRGTGVENRHPDRGSGQGLGTGIWTETENARSWETGGDEDRCRTEVRESRTGIRTGAGNRYLNGGWGRRELSDSRQGRR